MKDKRILAAVTESFDTFWEAPKDIEKGFRTFKTFYKYNYGPFLPRDQDSNALVVSCGTGYFVNFLNESGFMNVIGIDSDHQRIKYAREKGLNCEFANAFAFLEDKKEVYDLIFLEQEINHLTKEEIVDFLKLCNNALVTNGKLILHSLNGANPITGAEALAQNFDHYNTFTEYSLRQVLSYTGFASINVIPLKLYVFFSNPLNYIGIVIDFLLTLCFRGLFIFYGKNNKIFSKKLAAIAQKK